MINLVELARQKHNIELRQDIDRIKKDLKDTIKTGITKIIKGGYNDN